MARPARSSSRRAIATALVADDRRALVLALEVERARQPAEQPDAQLRAPRRRARPPPPRAARPRPGRRCPGASTRPRSRSPPARAARPSASSRAMSAAGRERLQRVERLAGAVARGAELEEHLRAPAGSSMPQLERGAQPRRRLVEGQRRGGRPRGEHVVLDGALGAAERRGGGEVVREVGERAAGALRRRCSSASPTRRWSSARRSAGEPVVERPAHELVGEAVGQPRATGSSSIIPLRTASSSAARQLGLRERRRRGGRCRARTRRRPWPPARAGRWCRGARRESRWLTTSRTLSGVPSSAERPGQPDRAVGDLHDARSRRARARARRPGTALPLGEVADRPRELAAARRRAAAGGAPDELGHLLVGEARRAAAGRRRRSGAGRRASPTAPPARRPRCRGRWRAAAAARRRPPARGGAGAGASARRPSARPRARAAPAGAG